MQYRSTRSDHRRYTFHEAVRQALADDGGLIVPDAFPTFTTHRDDDASATYASMATAVLAGFVPTWDPAHLSAAVHANYDRFEIPLIRTEAGNFLELFHGPTGAFKDIALTFLPKIDRITSAGSQIYLTATSGDTGKAALEAFRDQPGTRIMVFYPEKGVSELQKLQMQTQEGENVRVVAIQGDFDDAQRGVKALLQEFRDRGVSSCNSINIARLVTQIPYYFWAAKLMGGQPLRFVVPTGNFGDILAGYYAKQMGLAVTGLTVATNTNDVLHRFFRDGVYDRRRELTPTSSPSMDILVSSNLERLIFHKLGHQATSEAMQALERDGVFALDPEDFGEFSAERANESEVRAAIRTVYETAGYLMDPHTACAWVAWDKQGRPEDTVILSTASPFKFPVVMVEALYGQILPEQEALLTLSRVAPIHPALDGIFDRPKRHTSTIRPEEMRASFLAFAEARL